MPSTAPDAVQVAAAIIWDDAGQRLLISRRPDHLHKGGCWEFPGGKIEAGETAEAALARELAEELDIGFGRSAFYRRIDYCYPEKTVSLHFYQIYSVSGDVNANEGQEWRWVLPAELAGLHFPEANQPIVDALLYHACPLP